MTHAAIPLAISGVLLQPLAVIPTSGGPVLHMLRADSPFFLPPAHGFGEVYFSEIYPDHVKAWKCHTHQVQRLAVPAGSVQFILYDNRDDSLSYGQLLDICLGRPDNYNLLIIPTGIWYGFRAVSSTNALICNCPDMPHDPDEGLRLPADSSDIPYTWPI